MPNAVDKLSAVNPYSDAARLYHKSPFQDFLGAMGFRTGNQAWSENMAIQAAEYQAGLAQKAYDEEYNLPVNQVARMRAAGINPDLNGGDSIDSGSAQPMGEDPSVPMQSEGDEGKIQNFASSILGVFSTSLGLVQSVQGIMRGRIENSILATQSEQNFSDWSNQMAMHFIPDKPDSVVDELGVEHSWQDQALESAKIFARKNLPKKMQQKFLDEINAFWHSAPKTNEAFDVWKQTQDSRFGYGMSRSTFGDLTIDDVLYGITKPLGDLALKELQYSSKASAKEAENVATYQDNLDPALAATAQNTTNESTIATNQINSMLRGTMVDILSFLRDASSGKGVGAGLAKIAMALLSAQSLQMLPSLPNLSFSKGVGPKGVSSKFSLGF